MSVIKPPAAVLAAALLAWIPAAQAGSSFSIILNGGHSFDHGHFHGKRYGHYDGYRHRNEHYRHYLGRPDHYYRRHGGPYWRPWHSYRPDRHYYRWAGPRCIYRYGHRYCR